MAASLNKNINGRFTGVRSEGPKVENLGNLGRPPELVAERWGRRGRTKWSWVPTHVANPRGLEELCVEDHVFFPVWQA